ncbi:MAG: biotin transporter BioY [Candidatus Nealsonbacteria bacterium CG_4_9_14_3_um_filter_37_13]|uniref:Biotin transporter n=3 Tax=Bacteria candidate phyla TaxID=1783234 RepID=A0A2M7VKM7_9BACT|nr:MAG: biotin transporter BioY [Candidatus Nealsonbacteria bacterium CG10_big_fil_rev_8_21_14_0_10_37_25]PJA02402.1 MAG: biotin transporter BioY [bacterium (Candidatus Gribaldobacteria) CG_4_10_14_0_2_um_filter_36_18]PJA84010.1 MAG: biotin transporter BioY [Candidatus Nealsonbacteria bacterium CG_4_9_14_3_um_filter_37_13]
MAEVKNLTLINIIIPRIENKILALVKNIVLVLSFAIVTGVAAQLKLEIGVVPITMQTLAVLLSGALLGSKRGALSQITYFLMGLAGLPWFARGGGMAYLMSPTFGYIIGFVLAAYSIGWLCERGFDRQVKTAILAMLIGNILLYIPGLLWLAKFIGFGKVLSVGLYPFIPGDLLKILLAGLALPMGWRLIKKYEG